MKRIILIPLLLMVLQTSAQNIYVAKATHISFFAGTPVEDIDATNTSAVSFMNIKTGDITISIPNRKFHFKRSLMEEHFNENYMESEKYPTSEFKGKIDNIQQYDFSAQKTYQVTISGILTIHGVSKPRTLEVSLTSSNEKLEGTTTFKVLLADYNIDRPKILWEKIAENVDITATFTYEPYKK